MSVATLSTNGKATARPELVPKYYPDTELIITPKDNPVYSPAMLADLVESMQAHGQLVPGWLCPSPELPDGTLLCIEGNRRLAVARLLGLPFWAFDLGRDVSEAERIRLIFQHHHSRRVMSREEVAERAARFIELTGCPAAEAARYLNISGPTLSRAFGEKRIPTELKARADQLGLSIRSLVAAMPLPLMAKAIAFAEAPGPDGRPPTRDQVGLHLRQLRKTGRPKTQRAKTVTLRLNGRAVTLAVTDTDSALSVAEDLKAIGVKLGKLADVPPDGWPFLFP